MRRILADELHLRQIRARRIETRSSGTRWTINFRERRLIIADDASIQAIFLKRLGIILPVHAKVQGEIGTKLPFIFKIGAHLALHLPEVFCRDFRRTSQNRVFGAPDSERFIDVVNGSCEVGEQVASKNCAVGG